MQRQAYPGAAGSFEGFPVDPERSHFASGEKHHMPAFHLQAIITEALACKLCGGRFEHDVLGAEMKCSVR